jgi:hypothetical protein
MAGEAGCGMLWSMDSSCAALIIMCGLPYSGKSTLANALSDRRKYALVAFDTLWQEITREQGKPPSGDLILNTADERITANLTHGNTTVYDTLHSRADWRDRVVSVATACGAPHVIVYLNTQLFWKDIMPTPGPERGIKSNSISCRLKLRSSSHPNSRNHS